MIVPTYTASAKNITGVAGQAMTFKVPGGALSQGQVAEAQFYGKVSSTAAGWGSAFYGMHRSAVTSKAVTEATASLDKVALAAQSKDVLAPNEIDQPSGFFAHHAQLIATKAAAASWDPITQRDIAGLVSSQITTRQRETNKLSRLRIVKHDQAFLADREEHLRDEVARSVPEKWDGDIDTLPAHGQSAYYDLQTMRKKAAGRGTIDHLQEQKGSKEDRSYITKLAIKKRLIAAKTSAETQDVLRTLQDGTSWPMLTNKDLQILELKAHRQSLVQQGKEAAAAKQAVVEQRRAKKNRQDRNENKLLVDIYAARNKNHPMVPVGRVQNTDLDPAARRAIMAMLQDNLPKNTDTDYFNDIHDRLLDIELSGDEPDIMEDKLTALQKEVHGEVGKEFASKINMSDALAFSTQVRAIREKRGKGAALKLVYQQLEATIKKLDDGTIDGREMGRLNAGRAKARRVLYTEGGTQENAVSAGLEVMGFGREELFHPPALPVQSTFGIASNPKNWSEDDHLSVMQWISQNPTHFTSARERDQTLQQMEEIRHQILTLQGQAEQAQATRRAKKGTKDRDFTKFLGRFENRTDVPFESATK